MLLLSAEPQTRLTREHRREQSRRRTRESSTRMGCSVLFSFAFPHTFLSLSPTTASPAATTHTTTEAASAKAGSTTCATGPGSTPHQSPRHLQRSRCFADWGFSKRLAANVSPPKLPLPPPKLPRLPPPSPLERSLTPALFPRHFPITQTIAAIPDCWLDRSRLRDFLHLHGRSTTSVFRHTVSTITQDRRDWHRECS